MRKITVMLVMFGLGAGFGMWTDNRRDASARLASIGGGADEVMMGIIAKIMGVAKKPLAQ